MTRVALLICLIAGSAAAAPCPRHAALARVAAAVFPLEARPIDPARLTCTPVRGPSRLALLLDDTGDGLLIALVSGATAVWEDGYVTQDSLRDVIESARAADLDGDGVDELLIVSRHDGHERSGGTTLHVMEPPDATVAELVIGARNGTMPIADGGSDCESSWTLARGPHRTRRIVTDGGCRGAVPDGFAIGRHTYALRGGELVEIGAR